MLETVLCGSSSTRIKQYFFPFSSVYNALGLASFDFYDEVDFDVWFSSHLLDELQNTHPK